MSPSVFVTAHAELRARERFGRGFDASRIRGEIRAGTAEGRIGCKPPRGYGDRGRRKKLKQRPGRYVWNEDGSRCYCVKERTVEGRKVVIVTTVLVPDVAVAA